MTHLTNQRLHSQSLPPLGNRATQLSPSERLAFVLHDLFAVPFEDIAPIVAALPPPPASWPAGPTPLQGGDETLAGDRRRRQEVVEAFLAASCRGDFEALVTLLDPDAVLRADHAEVKAAAANRAKAAPLLAPEVRGGRAVANALVGRAQAAQLALIDGSPGLVWALGGKPRTVFAFRVIGTTIAEIEIVTDPSVVTALPVTVL